MTNPNNPSQDGCGCVIIIVLIVAAIFGWNWLQQQSAITQKEFSKKLAEDNAILDGARMAKHINLNLQPGFFEHTIYITNGPTNHPLFSPPAPPPLFFPLRPIDPSTLCKCDLTFTVLFENGESHVEKKYWEFWHLGDVKEVAIPAKKSVQRIELKGTVYSEQYKLKGAIKKSFLFGR